MWRTGWAAAWAIAALGCVIYGEDDVVGQPPDLAPLRPVSLAFGAGGLAPRDVTVRAGTLVTFSNEDVRPHQVASNDVGGVFDCPELNASVLQPGQRFSVTMSLVRTCRFFDPLSPGDALFQGTLQVLPGNPTPTSTSPTRPTPPYP